MSLISEILSARPRPGTTKSFSVEQVDQLNTNTHKSESLVKLVASSCGITTNLGVKAKEGILKSIQQVGENSFY